MKYNFIEPERILFYLSRRIYFRKFYLLLCLIALTLQYSCIEKELDFDSIKTQKWNSEWAMPLVNSTLMLEDFLNDSSGIINEDPDGLITLVYESEELVSVRADEVAEIPDQVNEELKVFDLPVIPPGISAEIPLVFSFPFELDEEGLRIDSIIFNQGSYNVTVSTDINRDVLDVELTVPNFLQLSNNEPLQISMSLDNPQGTTITGDTTIDLSMYRLVFDEPFADTNYVYIHALIHFTGDDNPLNNPYFLQLNNDFSELEFGKFFGYAGERTVQMSDTIEVDIFNVNDEGYFSFGPGSVNMTVEVENSFGLPVILDLETIKAYRTGFEPDSVDVYIFGEGNPSLVEINSPAPGQIGETLNTTIVSDNSNFHEALEISPDKIFVDIIGLLNSDNNPSISNFILDTSKISASMALELELFGSINGYTIADTIDFNIDNLDNIESLLFAVDIENGFPINAVVQLEFVDSLYQVVHTLLPDGEQLMTAADVSGPPDYRVTNPSSKITEIVLNKEELGQLEEARQILIKAVLTTTENQVVKIYSDYSIGLELGAKVGIGF